ncbi:acyltransferase family protein [Zavarzinella formosa]|uniref:acyltransferase family protein n=1 Tax=Zavarzinella formosa TaxID=360055 RepID=UPI000305A44B|nr:acyltransferase [Zavarzinella formosa]
MNQTTPFRLSGRDPALDAIRGLAILTVTIFRFGTRTDDGTPIGAGFTWLCGAGDRGVDLFFVLSGFLITGVLFDAKGQSHYLRNFFVRRSLRIFPLYFGVLFAAFVLLPRIYPEQTFVNVYTIEHQEWLWMYGTNNLLSIDWLWPLGVFNHFWSLAVEEHFYVVWPFVILFLGRRMAMNACLFLIGMAISCRFALGVMKGNFIAAEVLTICRMDSLAIGAFLALMVRGPGGMAGVVPWAWRLGPLAVIIVVTSELLDKGGFYLPYTLTAIACASLIVWALTATDRFSRTIWHSRVLRKLGQYSYAMYVFQNLLVPAGERFWPVADLIDTLGSLGGRLAYVALGFGVTFVAAFISWHAYEKHFLKLKKFFGGEQHSPTAPPAEPKQRPLELTPS